MACGRGRGVCECAGDCGGWGVEWEFAGYAGEILLGLVGGARGSVGSCYGAVFGAGISLLAGMYGVNTMEDINEEKYSNMQGLQSHNTNSVIY